MPQWLIIASIVASLLPLLQSIVLWVEELAKGQPGAFKKEQAMALLKSILSAGNVFFKLDQASIDVLMTLASTLIDVVVAVMNSTGALPKIVKA